MRCLGLISSCMNKLFLFAFIQVLYNTDKLVYTILVATTLHITVYKANGLIEEMILRGGDNNWLKTGTRLCMLYLYAGSRVCSLLRLFLRRRWKRLMQDDTMDIFYCFFTFVVTQKAV